MSRQYPAIVQRARFLGLCFSTCFVLAWLAAFYPFTDRSDRFGAPLGGDFLMFFAAGQTVLQNETDKLYDDQFQQQQLHRTIPELRSDYTLPFRYPPLVAWCMSLLARFPYATAYALFALVMLVCWWSAAYLLARPLAIQPLQQQSAEGQPGHSLAAAARWLMIGWPVGWEAVIGGQASPVALLISTATWALLRTGRPVLAGAVLALALYKPNVLMFVVFGCLLAKPRMLLGAVITWSLLLVLTWLLVGMAGIIEYVQYSTQLAVDRWQLETPFWKVHGLGNLLGSWLGGFERLVLLIVGCSLTVAIAWRWRSRCDEQADTRALSCLLFVNFLCNPYVPVYDLILLMAAAMMALNAFPVKAVQIATLQRRVQWLVLLLMIGPHLSQGLAKSLGFQLFPLLVLLTILVLFGLHAPRYRRQVRRCALS